MIDHALILCSHPPIRNEHLPQRFSTPKLVAPKPISTVNLRELEVQAIHEALSRHNGNKAKAAEELGISLKTLYNKLNQSNALSKTG